MCGEQKLSLLVPRKPKNVSLLSARDPTNETLYIPEKSCPIFIPLLYCNFLIPFLYRFRSLFRPFQVIFDNKSNSDHFGLFQAILDDFRRIQAISGNFRQFFIKNPSKYQSWKPKKRRSKKSYEIRIFVSFHLSFCMFS